MIKIALLRYQARLGRLLARLGRLRARLGRLREIWGMPKMRWCFTRFRHAARTARGGPKCVGTSLGLGCRALRAYAARRVRDSLLSFWVLDQDIVAAHVHDSLLRADATRCGSHAV